MTNAKEFALTAHKNQTRKGKITPYSFHLYLVNNILETLTEDPHIIATGWLHDTVEDTDVSLEDIKQEFNDEIYSYISLEKELRVKLGDNYLINGIIDKLEFDNDLIRVVDYKTGSAQRGIEELEVGHDYWRQAVFYNLLLENSSEIDMTDKRIETQYIFLDDNSTESGYSIHTIQVTKEDLDLVTSQIQNFWSHMNTADFTGSCGKNDCDYCRLAEFVDFELLKENIESGKESNLVN